MMTQRSDQQRKSIELYCKRVAEALNDSGESVQTVFTMPIDCSQQNVKSGIFKVVMRALYPEKADENGNISTTDLNTEEVTEVYENMNRVIAERYGISVDFPSEQALYNESQERFSRP